MWHGYAASNTGNDRCLKAVDPNLTASGIIANKEPTMKSYTIQVQAGGTVLEPREAPVPVAGADQVLVRLHAAGLNRGEFIAAHGLHAKSGVPKPAGVE